MAEAAPSRGTMVVTGASSGIGAATAILAAARGWRLVLAARNRERLSALAAECIASGASGAVPVPLDLAEPGASGKLALALEGLPGPIALINNAGVFTSCPFLEVDEVTIEREVAVNLVGLLKSTRAVLPRMVVDGVGDVVNILSVAATSDLAGAAVYSATKAGGRQFGRALALEVRDRGIRVCNLSPGPTATPIWDGQPWRPEAGQMMLAEAVARVVVDVVEAPRDRRFDEIVLTPMGGAG